jgi:hypothetical protein
MKTIVATILISALVSPASGMNLPDRAPNCGHLTNGAQIECPFMRGDKIRSGWVHRRDGKWFELNRDANHWYSCSSMWEEWICK